MTSTSTNDATTSNNVPLYEPVGNHQTYFFHDFSSYAIKLAELAETAPFKSSVEVPIYPSARIRGYFIVLIFLLFICLYLCYFPFFNHI